MSRRPRQKRWVVESPPLEGRLGELFADAGEKAFDDEEQARRECDLMEQRTRRKANPFRLGRGALASLTSLEPALFRDWLLDAGLDPPPLDPPPDWAGWYDRRQPGWDDAQRERFWQALDRLRFHRVVERPPRKAYVVLEVGWLWHDEPPYTTDPECRRAVEAFSDRAAAERRRRELDGLRQAEWPGHITFEVDVGPGERLGPAAAVRHHEVVEIDWEGEP